MSIDVIWIYTDGLIMLIMVNDVIDGLIYKSFVNDG